MNCNQCEMVCINGYACHEAGCPNRAKRWSVTQRDWVREYFCPECGCGYDTLEERQQCCAGNDDETSTEEQL